MENNIKSFSNVDFDTKDAKLNIKVVGVGGSGCNIINQLQNSITNNNVSLYAFDTDAWSLKKLNNINNLFIIDKDNLKGYGSNGSIDNAKQGIIHDADKIKQELQNTDILFLASSLGKATGSGAIPEIARIAKSLNILTISVVSMPSITSEGQEFYNIAYNALEELKKYTTAITTLSNERIIANNPNVSFFELYKKSNNEFCLIISKIIKLITNSNKMNIDYSDLQNFFLNNKFFMFNNFIIKNKNINSEILTQAFESSVNNNISDVNIVGASQMIAWLNLANDVNNNFLIMFKDSCVKVIQNKNINIKYGADVNPNNESELTYLIAGNNSLPDLNTEINKLLNEDIEPDVEVSQVYDEEGNEDNNDDEHHYDELISELESALNPTKELKTARIKQDQTQDLDNKEIDSENDKQETNDNDLEDCINDIG